MAEVYGGAVIEPYGKIQLGPDVLDFRAGMCFLNEGDDITVETGMSLINEYGGNPSFAENEKDIAVLIGSGEGIKFYSAVAFQLFCQAMCLK